jgi:GNAT superfamily N-acetyltransferase
MAQADIPVVSAVFNDAMEGVRVRFNLPEMARTPAQAARFEQRVAHLLGTDPGGSFVAVSDDRVVGLSQALVRDDFWVLSLLGVAPDNQESGVGRRLLEAALDYRGRSKPGMILCSRDPRAMVRYTSAGFDLHPAVAAYGSIRLRPPSHDSVRIGTTEDLGVIDAIDRDVRGAARGEDLAYALSDPAITLFLEEDRAYALGAADRVVMAGGRDEASATRVLETALAATAADHVELGWLTGPQQWAIRVAVSAGIELRPMGPVMLKGRSLPMPYIPSGAFG